MDDVVLRRCFLCAQLGKGIGRVGRDDLHRGPGFFFELRDDALAVRGLVGAAEGIDPQRFVLCADVDCSGTQCEHGESYFIQMALHGVFPFHWLEMGITDDRVPPL